MCFQTDEPGTTPLKAALAESCALGIEAQGIGTYSVDTDVCSPELRCNDPIASATASATDKGKSPSASAWDREAGPGGQGPSSGIAAPALPSSHCPLSLSLSLYISLLHFTVKCVESSSSNDDNNTTRATTYRQNSGTTTGHTHGHYATHTAHYDIDGMTKSTQATTY